MDTLSTIEHCNDVGSRIDAEGVVEHLVPTATLNEALAERLAPSDAVGFIKIDVEGHELAVLEGARATIERHRPALLLEIEFRHGARVAETFAFLQQRDYRAFVVVGSTLSAITVDELAVLQSDEWLQRKLKEQRYVGYVNNVFFLPVAYDDGLRVDLT